MIKKIIFGLAAVATLASCNGDYDDWASPQANQEKDAAEKFVMAVQPTVSSIDFETETAENIQLFSSNLAEGQTESFNVTLSGADNGVSAAITATPEGYVAAADLQGAVATVYGKAPVERAFNVTVGANVKVTTENGSVQVDREGAPFQLSVKLVAPYISEHYYIVGAPSVWTPNDKSLPFTHSGGNVYDNPEFTVTFPISATEDVWFAIGDDKVADENDWNSLYGCVEGNGNNGLEGKLARRSELSDDGSFKIPAGSGKYAKMTINMMDCTYKIEYLNDPELFMTGSNYNWGTGDGAWLPFTPVYDTTDQFWRVVYLDKDEQIKFAPQAAWGNDFGGSATIADEAGSGLVSDAGGSNLVAGHAGWYILYVTTSATPVVKVLPANVYLVGNTVGSWDVPNPAALFTVPDTRDGEFVSPAFAATDEVRICVKLDDAIDWWKSEFIVLNDKIEYRGKGGDQTRHTGQAGERCYLNFTAGTGSYK